MGLATWGALCCASSLPSTSLMVTSLSIGQLGAQSEAQRGGDFSKGKPGSHLISVGTQGHHEFHPQPPFQGGPNHSQGLAGGGGHFPEPPSTATCARPGFGFQPALG